MSNKDQYTLQTSSRTLIFLCSKVIADKPCGEVSLLEQNTIENASKPIKEKKNQIKLNQIFEKKKKKKFFLPLKT